ncbi:hypothetical protein D1AOALGA4SA_9195 [Olavius algarvensis Delta 1 endosymbiont]|nr:hypothetical protein D1AOALGA4SA_9195 [Olavius algarvensis Delta 1 endosymbiont]
MIRLVWPKKYSLFSHPAAPPLLAGGQDLSKGRGGRKEVQRFKVQGSEVQGSGFKDSRLKP